ncbi:hypothetical protein QSJ18_17070 [Gordonia sp. ABSL1-1]|uniref:hypothetical protein n=1 Tax=Gordonia sp. ABSL1-1 TaxID=3053923 RepID=UPI0025734D9D|nr:hypothetical protein [Gordonia sp. ABSL1-1]MDL9938462.1 hypothetical protein [Gordonia sp. ABSL1-1]
MRVIGGGLRRRSWVRAVALVGVVLVGPGVLAGCSSPEADQPAATVTVTSTIGSSPPGVESGSSSVPTTRGADYPGLRDSFTAAVSVTGATVGVAMAPVGGDAVAALTLGDRTDRVAWSTIKVPLAVAAERVNGPSAAETAAIIDSDNDAAQTLWSSLGSDAAAAQAVTSVLREGGDQTSVVPARQRRAGYTIFGQTRWSLSAAATFTAHLPCMPGTDHVRGLMGRVAGNQQWGVEIMRAPTSTAVKGGWGPGESSGYLVRQIGIITFGDGRATAVAMSALAGSMSGGVAALNAVANWLSRHLRSLPRGRCPA